MNSTDKTEPEERFARNLRELRATKELSRRELADRAELHEGTIGKLENGRCLPLIDTIHRLSGALGVPPNDLFEGISWEPPTPQRRGFYRDEDPEDRK